MSNKYIHEKTFWGTVEPEDKFYYLWDTYYTPDIKKETLTEVIASVVPVLDSLDPTKWFEIRKTIYDNPYIPHKPFGNQLLYLIDDAEELLYGGRAGGGKSDAELMGALQGAEEKDFAALLLRRTFKDLSLPGALMSRAHEWLSQPDSYWENHKVAPPRWDNISKTWHFPHGATVTFGYLQYENDKFQYQGAEFQHIGFDELTQFTETQYLYLFSRLRQLENSLIQMKMRAASNPGGVGHLWVKQRFIDEGVKYHRPYIPSSYMSNPFINRITYEQSLMLLDYITRRQLMHGDWYANPFGGLFKREWFSLLEPILSPDITRIVRYWDLAHSKPKKEGDDPDYTVGLLMGLDVFNRIWIIDIKRCRGTPLEVQNLILKTAKEDAETYGVVEIFMEQEPAAGIDVIDHYTRDVLAGFPFKGIRSTTGKEDRAKAVSAYIEAGNCIMINGNWHNEFLNEIEAFPTVGIHDDQVDCLSGAFNQLFAGSGAFIMSIDYI